MPLDTERRCEIKTATSSAASSSQLSSNTGNPSSSNPNLLYHLKITVFDYHCGDKDGRWRRVIVPANFSLYGLHIV